MKVIEIKTGNFVEVHSIENDKCGYPKFLIYKNGQWIWRSAKYFKPAGN